MLNVWTLVLVLVMSDSVISNLASRCPIFCIWEEKSRAIGILDLSDEISTSMGIKSLLPLTMWNSLQRRFSNMSIYSHSVCHCLDCFQLLFHACSQHVGCHVSWTSHINNLKATKSYTYDVATGVTGSLDLSEGVFLLILCCNNCVSWMVNNLLYSLEMQHTHTNVCWFLSCCKCDFLEPL